MAVTKWNDMQLEFDLGLDEAAEDAAERSISLEAARQISEAARQTWLANFNSGATDRTPPEWIADYLQLIEQGWPWRVACYIAWASSPKTARSPKTLAELATDVLGLTGPRVIHNWRKKHPTIDQVVAMMQSAPLWQHRRDVLEALAEMAMRPDYKAHNDRKLFLEMIGDYVPKSKLELGKAGKGSESEMSDEELRQWTPDEEIKQADSSPETETDGDDDSTQSDD